MERRPVIGLCASLEPARFGAWHEDAVLLPHLYVQAVQRAGGLALLLAPDEAAERDPDEVLDLVEALIVAGGIDIDPASYGAVAHAKTSGARAERDRFEIALTRRALERDMPLLGICRGMQVLNIARGGTLRQHLPEELGHDEHRRVPGTFESSDHEVRLAEGSLASRVCGSVRHAVKSHHHQGVDAVGEGLSVTGWAVMDELPEALEDPGRRFALGVQWHPEADELSPVVGALVGEARQRRSERAGVAA